MKGDHFNQKDWRGFLLLPLSLLFRFIVFIRSTFYKAGWLVSSKVNIPIIVVGNITVGGTGKTPMVVELVSRLKMAGLAPGIVSRGYGSANNKNPILITDKTSVQTAGDEPLQLALMTGVPVCICAKRADAVQYLLSNTPVNVIVSDDGLQHYAMARSYEIAVLDGTRGLGNGWMLPSGPLREPASRLQTVQLLAIQRAVNDNPVTPHGLNQLTNLTLSSEVRTGSFMLSVASMDALGSSKPMSMLELSGEMVHAVAGLGNPERFFALLKHNGIEVIEHAMPDHHNYQLSDVQFSDKLPVLMTSKDAVKLKTLPNAHALLNRHYEIQAKTEVDDALNMALQSLISSLSEEQAI